MKEVLYPVVGERVLRELVKEYRSSGPLYRRHVHTVILASYRHHYRRMVPALLRILTFRSNNEAHRPLIRALALLKQYADSDRTPIYFAGTDDVPIEGVVKPAWREIVIKMDAAGNVRINRMNYEIAVLQLLRERIRRSHCLEDALCGCLLEQLYVAEDQLIIALRGLHLAPPSPPHAQTVQLICPDWRVDSTPGSVQQLLALPDYLRQLDDIIWIGPQTLLFGMTGGAWLLVDAPQVAIQYVCGALAGR